MKVKQKESKKFGWVLLDPVQLHFDTDPVYRFRLGKNRYYIFQLIFLWYLSSSFTYQKFKSNHTGVQVSIIQTINWKLSTF